MHRKNIVKLSIPVLVTSVVGLLLWLSGPQIVKAVEITYPSLPASGTLGQQFTFITHIAIQNQEVFPIQNINLNIKAVHGSNVISCQGLPLTNSQVTYQELYGPVQIVASTSGLSYGYGYRYARGYWEPGNQDTYFGYGYGYGSPVQTITYTITWTPNLSLSPGNYEARIVVNGDNNHTFTISSSKFFLDSPVIAAQGGGTIPGIGETDLTRFTDLSGIFNLETKVTSDDGLINIDFMKGTKAINKDGTGLKSIKISPMTNLPELPENTQIIGLVYELLPEGAIFIPSVNMTIEYDYSSLPKGVEEANLIVAKWDNKTGSWIELQGKVDVINHSITIQIQGFSSYAIITHNKQELFVLSNLKISPTQIEEGQIVDVSIIVNNSGDLTGNYDLVMKVNGILHTKRQVSLTGGESETITFTIQGIQPGTNTIEINGFTGSFIVESTANTEFSFSQLNITPDKVKPGEPINVSVIAVNHNENTGTKTIDILLDGTVYTSQTISLKAGESREVKFEITVLTEGEHKISLDGLNGIFTVKVTEEIKIEAINWWIVGGIIAAILIISILTWLFIKRSQK